MLSALPVNGVSLRISHTITHPSASTIIFLHDSLGCITLWRDFPEKLGAATGCNVLVYDRQGYGQSAPLTTTARNNDYMELEAAILQQLMAQLQLTDVILFGHSDGASIALMAAGKYPAGIKGVIAEGAHIFVEDLTLQGIRDAATAYTQTNLKERLQKYHGANTEAMFEAWAGTWLKAPFRSWNIEHFLPGIQCPVLVIQGENDEYGTLAQVDGILNQVTGVAQSLIIPGIGHTPHKEAADMVLDHAAAFIHTLL
jgi:pimeloyl-ACP methyl ester carboxylesterase